MKTLLKIRKLTRVTIVYSPNKKNEVEKKVEKYLKKGFIIEGAYPPINNLDQGFYLLVNETLINKTQ